MSGRAPSAQVAHPIPHGADLVGQVLDGAYQLTRLIYEGAMGTVYEAVQLRLNKRVAVKVMVPELAANPEALGRFRRELEVTSQLAHPNVIQLLDYGVTASSQPYLVMEYLDGEDLEQRLKRVGRLPLPIALHVFSQVASALGVIHAKGIVHRDLKPANVFLLPVESGADFVKVVDFGISKVRSADTKLTQAFTMVGTPESMSPEQATGRVDDVDHRSDQWALACTVWRAISGGVPFGGATVRDLLHEVVNGEPRSLLESAPDLPPALEGVLRRALSKRQDDRFPTIAAFWRAFESAAETALKPAPRASEPEPLVVPAPSRPRRKEVAFILGVMTLLGLTVGGTIVYRTRDTGLHPVMDRVIQALEGLRQGGQ
jgi:eukaryotic-like serine/threonine-protein kinase